MKKHPLLTSYLYVASFSVMYQLVILSSGMSGTVGLRQALLMSSLWLLPLMLWPRYHKVIGAMIGLLLLPAALLNLGYWMLYGQDFSQSVLFIVFESNWAEGSEFLESYWQWWHPLALAVFIAIPVYLWSQLQAVTLSAKQRGAGVALVSLTVFWPLINTWAFKGNDFDAAVYHQLHRMEPAAPWTLVVGYQQYRTNLANMESLLAENASLPPLKNFQADDARLPQRLVIVIGESTNRERMSLYGYGRATSPGLEQLKNELTVFTDVISPRPYTIESLQQVLSLADQRHPDDFYTRPNVLNMLKQAGYHITWITNQQTQTRRNTLLTTLSQMADEQVYLNNNREQNASQHDDSVLQPFAATLQQSYPRQAIFVHLLGTHRKYSYRYPDNYRVFHDRQGVPEWVEDRNLEEYNSYDNAVLFNDHVVTELIHTLDSARQRSLLVYFSDHGEEVFDHSEHQFTGRNEGAPTTAMYTVPFIAWTSPQWRTRGSWQARADRPFQSSDFMHTLADMVGIRFQGWDGSRSLISDTFEARPRLIGNPESPQKLTYYRQLAEPESLAGRLDNRADDKGVL
nr:phosphoethanolamine transferase CptA [Aestuariicella hydrocarbonica]